MITHHNYALITYVQNLILKIQLPEDQQFVAWPLKFALNTAVLEMNSLSIQQGCAVAQIAAKL